jgi:hypothetical protein
LRITSNRWNRATRSGISFLYKYPRTPQLPAQDRSKKLDAFPGRTAVERPDRRFPGRGADRSLGNPSRFRVVKDHPGSRDPAVVLQESAEPFPALDLPGWKRDDVGLVATGNGRRHVAQALVAALPVKMA